MIAIGYIIVAHAHADHLVRLVQRLRSPGARFFVHVDRGAPPAVMQVVEQQLAGRDDVQLLPRHRVGWARFSQVEATLEGIHAILAHPVPLDYGVLLTGQDYPLRPPEVIERRLREAAGRSYLEYWAATGRWRARVDRLHWHGTVLGRRVKVPNRLMPLSIRRPVPGGLEPFAGRTHWCLSRACLEEIAGFVARRPAVLREFRWRSHPDESFFHTILMNSPLAGTIVNDDLRYVDWSQNLPSPRTLTTADLEAMLGSRDLFARKFDPAVDAQVLDLLDVQLDAERAADRRMPPERGGRPPAEHT
ncbi:MAG: beta-1,6-N-acetylglucosaminyltransferase [Thermoleophilia bacterium]